MKWCFFSDCCDSSLTSHADLPAPEVTITPDVASDTAGEELVLTCTATVVEHLTVHPTVQWSGGSVDSTDSLAEGETTRNGVTSSRTLTFSPLGTSHGAQYTCQAEISILSIDVTSSDSESRAVMVQSKSLYPYPALFTLFLCLSPSVPRPEVMVSAAESELVSGSPLSLTCSIQPSSVDTPTTVMSNWTAPNSTYNRANTVNATSVGLMISSVETADSGDYTCSVRAADCSGSEYVVDSEPETDSVNIVVSKFLWRSLME